ncbi:hypothetical protein GGI07_004832 [Coemansia sp. Benny D115]|nr:hypothetical protein GGI07_004832 [Coemansia sp. Benny D115]
MVDAWRSRAQPHLAHTSSTARAYTSGEPLPHGQASLASILEGNSLPTARSPVPSTAAHTQAGEPSTSSMLHSLLAPIASSPTPRPMHYMPRATVSLESTSMFQSTSIADIPGMLLRLDRSVDAESLNDGDDDDDDYDDYSSRSQGHGVRRRPLALSEETILDRLRELGGSSTRTISHAAMQIMEYIERERSTICSEE